ncbi:hypothetical protein ACIBHX_14740 [Nonomuraea sp. NPDC050536]|uniref:hypothetical protein n=1 Tax=Nonomuraea sp. NPDC050536 TaxID=3364366 RepID=UPI0037C9AE75
MARDDVVGDLIKGQVCLLGGLLVCMVVLPSCVTGNCGMSDFGVHWRTIVPYAIGLVGAGLFTRRGLRAAAPVLPAPRLVRLAGDSFALLLVGVLLTPYTLGEGVHWVHRTFGAALFLFQLILAIRLVVWDAGEFLAVVLVSLQFLSGVVSGLYVLSDSGHLVLSQAVFQAAFGLVMIRTVRRLWIRDKPPSPSRPSRQT